MSTYEELKGLKVKYLSSDTSGDRIQEGEVFYNSSDFNLKSFVTTAAWHSSAPMNTARYNQASGSTPTTAGVTFGGFVTPGPGPAHADTNVTEEYDGTGWASGGNMNTARSQFNGFGTQTTAVGAGGYINGSGDTAVVEEYNGSTWTEVTNIPAARRGQAGFGTLTAGVIVAGVPNSNVTLEYDGTNWTAGNNIGTGMDRTGGAGAGILTAGIVASGDTTESFTYDGTNWTDVGTTNSPHDGGHDTGVQTAAVITSGFPPPGSGVVTATELYDGTSFTTSATVATGRYGAARGGASGTTAFIAGGDVNPGTRSITEEFTISLSATTAGAWASGGNLTTARRSFTGGAGTQTAGLVAGGYISNLQNATEEYDGSSWPNGGNYPASLYYVSIGGTQTAGVGIGGGDPVISEGCEYDGSSWTDVTNAPESRKMMGRAGTQTAGLFAGGNDGPNAASSEAFTYNGSSFSNITDMPANRGAGHISGGSQTAAVMAAGHDGSSYVDTTVEWNGSAWGSGGTFLLPGQSFMNSNNTSGYDHIGAGGYLSGTSAITNLVSRYDGTSWFTSPSIATSRQQGAGFGTHTLGAIAGGTTGSVTNATEEFTGDTTAIRDPKTIDFD